MTGKDGQFDEIDVAAASPGVTPAHAQAARSRPVAAARPSTCAPARRRPPSSPSDIRDDLGFLQTALLAFAGISLFVGAFIIFNTFSITVAQRTREFALLRTLGASRRQVLRSVLGEGLVLGVARRRSSASGSGSSSPPGLRALFKAIGFDLPSTGTVVADAHDRRLARRRHGRHAALVPGPGAARDARAAGGGAARGRRSLPQARPSRLLAPLAVAADRRRRRAAGRRPVRRQRRERRR